MTETQRETVTETVWASWGGRAEECRRPGPLNAQATRARRMSKMPPMTLMLMGISPPHPRCQLGEPPACEGVVRVREGGWGKVCGGAVLLRTGKGRQGKKRRRGLGWVRAMRRRMIVWSGLLTRSFMSLMVCVLHAACFAPACFRCDNVFAVDARVVPRVRLQHTREDALVRLCLRACLCLLVAELTGLDPQAA